MNGHCRKNVEVVYASEGEIIAPIIGPTGLEEGLGFEDEEGGKTLLVFEQLPEIPEKTSDARQDVRTRA